MLLNLTDVLTSEGKAETIAIPLEMTEFSSRLGKFPVLEKSPVNLTFTNLGVGKAKVEGSVSLVFRAGCDRCLKELTTELSLNFDRIAASPEYAEADETLETDDLNYMEGCQFNTETFVYNEILLNWPMKILCCPECRGVCPVCGQNLNDGECGCDTFVPDPRMAVIKDIFNADKEV